MYMILTKGKEHMHCKHPMTVVYGPYIHRMHHIIMIYILLIIYTSLLCISRTTQEWELMFFIRLID